MTARSYSYKHLPSEKAVQLLPYVQMAGSFCSDENYVIKRKKYDSLLLVFTVSGKGYLKYDRKEYALSGQTGFIIDCNQPHVYFTDKKELWNFIWVHFNGLQAKKLVSFILENMSPVFTAGKNSVMETRLNMVLEVLPNRGLHYDILLANHLNAILGELLLKSSPGGEGNRYIPEVVTKAIEVMESQFARKLTLESLAQQIYTNKFDLSRKFKKYMGITPYEYLIKHRIIQSKNLLEGTKLTVAEVAAAVGFDDTSHFIKVFRKYEKTTPLKYRQYW